MHRRWGQTADDAKPYSSYAEEEFHCGYPCDPIRVARKSLPVPSV